MVLVYGSELFDKGSVTHFTETTMSACNGTTVLGTGKIDVAIVLVYVNLTLDGWVILDFLIFIFLCFYFSLSI